MSLDKILKAEGAKALRNQKALDTRRLKAAGFFVHRGDWCRFDDRGMGLEVYPFRSEALEVLARETAKPPEPEIPWSEIFPEEPTKETP